MSYIALYRVWRPARWEDVVDQKAVVRILKNALSEGKVSHAYLFSGPRGTGKTTVARLLVANPGCQMQIQAGLRAAGIPARVAHVVELLDESYAAAGLYE